MCVCVCVCVMNPFFFFFLIFLLTSGFSLSGILFHVLISHAQVMLNTARCLKQVFIKSSDPPRILIRVWPWIQ